MAKVNYVPLLVFSTWTNLIHNTGLFNAAIVKLITMKSRVRVWFSISITCASIKALSLNIPQKTTWNCTTTHKRQWETMNLREYCYAPLNEHCNNHSFVPFTALSGSGLLLCYVMLLCYQVNSKHEFDMHLETSERFKSFYISHTTNKRVDFILKNSSPAIPNLRSLIC